MPPSLRNYRAIAVVFGAQAPHSMFVRPICTELDPKGEDTSVVFMLERPSPNPSRFLFVGSFLRSVGPRPPAALGMRCRRFLVQHLPGFTDGLPRAALAR